MKRHVDKKYEKPKPEIEKQVLNMKYNLCRKTSGKSTVDNTGNVPIVTL